MKSLQKILFVIIIIMVIIAGGLYLYEKFIQKSSAIKEAPAVEKGVNEAVISATFDCAENKTIQAKFSEDKVDLILSDGRNISLPQTISASGARYANTDESFVFWNKGNTAFIEENNVSTFSDCVVGDISDKPAGAGSQSQAPAQMANPASVNCSKVGGTLAIQKRGDGGEYGVCFFEDNRQCEEWALLRGDCPQGGVKITGYDNDAEIFCAITGGQVEGVGTEIPMCKRIDGTLCNAQSNLDGDCPDPSVSEPNAGNAEAE